MIDGKSITAVLFVYNQENYLAVMLDSLLDQIAHVDKIVVVDDYSTDSTKFVIETYAARDPRIIYTRSKQKGKVFAFVTGLEKVDTDLFFVAAGDDFLLPNYVQYLYFDVLKKNDVKYCYARYSLTDANLQNPQVIDAKPYYTKKDLLEMNYTSGYLFGFSEIICCILPLPDSLLFEDWFTSIKLVHHFKRNYFSPEPVFLYRKHGQAATNVNRQRTKYLHSLTRDLGLYQAVLNANLVDSDDEKKLVETKIAVLRCKLRYGPLRALALMFKFSLSLRERLKVLVFPIFLAIKYKR